MLQNLVKRISRLNQPLLTSFGRVANNLKPYYYYYNTAILFCFSSRKDNNNNNFTHDQKQKENQASLIKRQQKNKQKIQESQAKKGQTSQTLLPSLSSHSSLRLKFKILGNHIQDVFPIANKVWRFSIKFLTVLGLLGGTMWIYDLYQQYNKEKAFYDLYMQKTVKEKLIENTFTNYENFNIIERQFNSLINKVGGANQVLIIEGPPGIGKTSSIAKLIANINQEKKTQDNNLEIYYISIKGNHDNPGEQFIQAKVQELSKLMGKLCRRQQQNKGKKIILIIDQINRLCTPKYKDTIKQWRGKLETLKIIAFSSCSKATQFWMNGNYRSLNRKLTLKLNKTQQIYDFLKDQLKLQKVSDDALKNIASKYTTFRMLSFLVEQFQADPANRHFLQHYGEKTQEQINSKLIDYFSPKIRVKKAQDLKHIIMNLRKSFGDKGSDIQLKNLLKMMMANEIFRYLGDEYRMCKGGQINFDVSNLKQMHQIMMPFKPDFIEYCNYLLQDRLYQENYIFSFDFNKNQLICAKQQFARQIMIYWVKNQIDEIQKIKILGAKHKKIDNQKQAIENIMLDLATKIRKNKTILEGIKEWTLQYEEN